MTDVTRILAQVETGDGQAAEQLLPLVYVELRRLAAAKMAKEPSGQTLQATALVHEAYLRLVDQSHPQTWTDKRCQGTDKRCQEPLFAIKGRRRPATVPDTCCLSID